MKKNIIKITAVALALFVMLVIFVVQQVRADAPPNQCPPAESLLPCEPPKAEVKHLPPVCRYPDGCLIEQEVSTRQRDKAQPKPVSFGAKILFQRIFRVLRADASQTRLPPSATCRW